ncbi:MAG: toll/interleukin-1 receptor domain-containing protein [Haliscomenobacter sp.]|nr:toll/interleukin-1 receptor domain-containing protein [Haliscomenobacter sp.]
MKRQLEEADLILLLISAHFMASDYIWKTELTRAMERHDRREAVIVPVFIKSCDWHGPPSANSRAFPKTPNPSTTPKTTAPGRTWPRGSGLWRRGCRAEGEVLSLFNYYFSG